MREYDSTYDKVLANITIFTDVNRKRKIRSPSLLVACTPTSPRDGLQYDTTPSSPLVCGALDFQGPKRPMTNAIVADPKWWHFSEPIMVRSRT